MPVIAVLLNNSSIRELSTGATGQEYNQLVRAIVGPGVAPGAKLEWRTAHERAWLKVVQKQELSILEVCAGGAV